ncbi:hypothetical protein HK100_001216 [Physocladia obscura]|uniref:Uncharacterized protein n=1 Tax=Physocladia obscura TaxID=109957 RepID=A0AAD5SZP3_9FUNG|nr:hypothetical protein HK100_001216 [Physocladia obscura]
MEKQTRRDNKMKIRSIYLDYAALDAYAVVDFREDVAQVQEMLTSVKKASIKTPEILYPELRISLDSKMELLSLLEKASRKTQLRTNTLTENY